MKKNNELLVKRLVVTGMMIALEIVLSRIGSIPFLTYKIGLYFVPMIVVAMLYGPVYAAAAWGLSDLIGAMLFPSGPFFIGFTISAILNGLIFGFLLYKNHTKLFRTILAIVLASTIVSMGFDTLWLVMYFKIISVNRLPLVIFTDRAIRTAIMAPVQFITIIAIGNLLGEFIYRNSTVFYEKKALRREAQRYYKEEFPAERDIISQGILEQLSELEQYRDAETVFCYIGRDNEIDTSRIIKKIISDNKRVVVPLCGARGVMTAREISGLEDLKPGRFGILEPVEDRRIVEKSDIDVAIIPTLLADPKGRRVGFGGGYYDRYLTKSSIYKVILCSRKMIKKKLPSTAFDIRGDIVLS